MRGPLLMVCSEEALKLLALGAQNPTFIHTPITLHTDIGSQVAHTTVMAFWLQPPRAEVGESVSCNAACSSDLFYYMCVKESWRFTKGSLPTSG